MAHTKVYDPIVQDGRKVRRVKRDRRDYGHITYYDDKKAVIYWVTRRTDQFLHRERSWMFEADAITAIRVYGVTHVGVKSEDGTTYLTPISTFSETNASLGVLKQRTTEYVDPKGRRGAVCWLIPVHMWLAKLPDGWDKSVAILSRVHMGRVRRSK